MKNSFYCTIVLTIVGSSVFISNNAMESATYEKLKNRVAALKQELQIHRETPSRIPVLIALKNLQATIAIFCASEEALGRKSQCVELQKEAQSITPIAIQKQFLITPIKKEE
ncbi:MAG: hypothetical protein WC707_03995 [Candidatus Babeliaceae bacterium]|jgi:hypothetical protein